MIIIKTGNGICFSGRPLKYPQRSDRDTDLNFRRGLKILIGETLKVFLHPPPPLERESFMRIDETKVSEMVALSIPKIGM
jgi:hypothetical protein